MQKKISRTNVQWKKMQKNIYTEKQIEIVKEKVEIVGGKIPEKNYRYLKNKIQSKKKIEEKQIEKKHKRQWEKKYRDSEKKVEKIG